jgi:DNA-binding LytR/AlgR family response regulator
MQRSTYGQDQWDAGHRIGEARAMSDLRVLLCDDEPLALTRLGALLDQIPGVAVAGSARDGHEVLAAVARDRPDLLLLDIERPGLDGFDVIERLGSVEPGTVDVPLVAFVTAFRRFAPEAYECGAIDFLSKPVRLSRLERSIDRARAATAGREARRRLADLQDNLDTLRGDQDEWRGAHVWVPRRGEVVRVDLEQVERITAEGAYVRLFVGDATFLHREAIGSIEQRLNPARFVRVHRSHVVRMDQVASVRRTIHGGGELILRDGECVPLGRRHAKEARRRLFGDRSASFPGIATRP